MNKLIKVAGISMAMLGSSIAFSANAAQKIAYVATAQVLAEVAQKNKLNEKLQAEFKTAIADIKRAETKLRTDLEKLKRDADVMGDKAKGKLQRELQAQDAALQLKVSNLREAQAKRAGEEQRKLLDKIQKTVQSIAQKKGYDMVIDRNAVVYGNSKDDLSSEVLKTIK